MVLFGEKINQKLEQRSYLYFEFPDEISRRIPFFENIDIVESKRANYIKYSPLGRSSPMYSYFGADARNIEIKFNINLAHIYDLFSKDLITLTFPPNSGDISKVSREDFFSKSKKSSNTSQGPKYKDSRSSSDRFLFNYLTLVKELNFEESVIQTAIGGSGQLSKIQRNIIDIIVYWVNLIRSSVINNSIDPTKGPPIIRVNHGILFQDVPCVCMNYSIEKDEIAGYDAATLLPRVIKVSMSLSEIRHGDFGKFEPNKPVKRDNIVGWEAIIQKNGHCSLDPLPIMRHNDSQR